MENIIGFGIAGNFAHHLDQAGESKDFENIKTKKNAPKGMFPFYVPNYDGFLGVNPLSSEIIDTKNADDKIQMEPEMGILFEIEYDDNKVKNIIPKKFFAYNDCSIRKEGAKKISEKKNWGKNTKGIAKKMIDIDKFTKGGILDSYHIASFLKNDKLYEYGEDSAVITYNYFYEELIEWIIDTLNNQKDFGPLENLSEYLKIANYPKEMIISIGATSYTPFGESRFLQPDDEIYVVVYDSNKYSPDEIKNNLDKLDEDCSILHQKII